VNKKLVFFMAHLDDFELSCMSYLIKHGREYDSILCVIASTWENKEKVWDKNLKKIKKYTDLEIDYINLGFEQRKLTSLFDEVKDRMYSNIDFDHKNRFDIITHDKNDCHSDHVTVYNIAKGLYKFTNRFLTVYSPSSARFNGNMWIGLSHDDYKLKQDLILAYNINEEQSYTGLGNYLNKEGLEKFTNSSYFLENFVYFDYKNYECYRVLKWI